MSDNDFADLAQFKLAHVSAATIGNHVDETFRYEAIDRFARRCATELEGLDEQRLINPTSGLQIQADDPNRFCCSTVPRCPSNEPPAQKIVALTKFCGPLKLPYAKIGLGWQLVTVLI